MYTKNRGFMKDMNKSELLKMREGGMSNREIALSLGCSTPVVYQVIGKQPEEISKRCRLEGMARRREMLQTPPDEKSVEVKMHSYMQTRNEEPAVPAVLVMKPVKMPIPLRGAFMHYVIAPDRDLIDVETEEGRVLIQIPADQLDTFIAELGAIKKNIGAQQPMQFWG